LFQIQGMLKKKDGKDKASTSGKSEQAGVIEEANETLRIHAMF